MRTTAASVPLLALLALALVGCGPTPGDPPVSPPLSSPTTPAPTGGGDDEDPEEPVDPLTTVTRILITADDVFFGDEVAWAVDGFYYTDDPELVRGKLTRVFGAEPTVIADPGSLETPPAQIYDWGGFRLGVPETDRPRGYYTSLWVNASSATVHGVQVHTVHDIRVGTPLADALPYSSATMDWDGGTGLELDPKPVSAEEIGEDPVTWIDLNVHVSAWAPGDVITELTAPARNFGS